MEVRVAYGLFHLPITSFMLADITLQGMYLSRVGTEWRLMLKGTRGKRYLVAFFYGPSWTEVLTLAITSIDSGHVDWTDDSHPPTKG